MVTTKPSLKRQSLNKVSKENDAQSGVEQLHDQFPCVSKEVGNVTEQSHVFCTTLVQQQWLLCHVDDELG